MTHNIFEMFTPEEWEAICMNCGMCCIYKVEDRFTHEIFPTHIICSCLDRETGKCTVYQDRFQKNPVCIAISPENMDKVSENAPSHCAYRCAYEGRKLPDWHPLYKDDSPFAKNLLKKLSAICTEDWTPKIDPKDFEKIIKSSVTVDDVFHL